MEAYIAEGNEPHREEWNESTGSYVKVSKTTGNYATFNKNEMFAECYTLIMTGNCGSKDCILKYFPKTLEASREHLKFIRSQDDDKRH